MSTITREFTKEQLQQIEAAAKEVLWPVVWSEKKARKHFSEKITPEVVLELARIALVSLEAEAAYFINRVKHSDAYGDDVELRTYCYELDALKSKDDFGGEIVPVYTTPPAPAVDADDNFYSWFGREWHEHYQQNQYTTSAKQMLGVMAESAWKAGRRAAMLQGAEPVTTANKLPANTPCKDAPEHIWLQTAGIWPENGEFSELTWCSDNQHQDDTLYVRADVVTGNSPVIPDGWVAVPVEPTAEMIAAAMCSNDVLFDKEDDTLFRVQHGEIWRSMLAAAPQQEVK